jgi:hypothetical protein
MALRPQYFRGRIVEMASPPLPQTCDSLRAVHISKIGTIQRRLAWPLRKDDTLRSRSSSFFYKHTKEKVQSAAEFLNHTNMLFCVKKYHSTKELKVPIASAVLSLPGVILIFSKFIETKD